MNNKNNLKTIYILQEESLFGTNIIEVWSNKSYLYNTIIPAIISKRKYEGYEQDYELEFYNEEDDEDFYKYKIIERKLLPKNYYLKELSNFIK